jgi:hypothetical protein
VVPPRSDRISRVPPYSRIIARITCTGLSPTMARLSRRFHLSCDYHWPGPRSLATTCGVSVDVLSCRYLDVSVPCVRHLTLCIQVKLPSNNLWKPTPPECLRFPATLISQRSRVGYPIRKSTDQRVFAPPRGLSQRITSFIACACQGIHQLPLRHLIVHIANIHLHDDQPKSVADGYWT